MTRRLPVKARFKLLQNSVDTLFNIVFAHLNIKYQPRETIVTRHLMFNGRLR